MRRAPDAQWLGGTATGRGGAGNGRRGLLVRGVAPLLRSLGPPAARNRGAVAYSALNCGDADHRCHPVLMQFGETQKVRLLFPPMPRLDAVRHARPHTLRSRPLVQPATAEAMSVSTGRQRGEFLLDSL